MKRLTLLLTITLFTLTLAGCSKSGTLALTESQRQTVADEVRQTVESWHREMVNLDVDLYIGHFSDDATSLVNGDKGLPMPKIKEKVLRNMFNRARQIDVAIQDDTVQVLGPKAAIYSARRTDTLILRDTGATETQTYAHTWVLTKEGNIWQIVHVHMSSVPF